MQGLIESTQFYYLGIILIFLFLGGRGGGGGDGAAFDPNLWSPEFTRSKHGSLKKIKIRSMLGTIPSLHAGTFNDSIYTPFTSLLKTAFIYA